MCRYPAFNSGDSEQDRVCEDYMQCVEFGGQQYCTRCASPTVIGTDAMCAQAQSSAVKFKAYLTLAQDRWRTRPSFGKHALVQHRALTQLQKRAIIGCHNSGKVCSNSPGQGLLQQTPGQGLLQQTPGLLQQEFLFGRLNLSSRYGSRLPSRIECLVLKV